MKKYPISLVKPINIFFLFTLVLILSCGGGGASKTNRYSDAPNVYAAGYEVSTGYRNAVYWKNGEIVVLSDGTRNASINSIIVLGNEIHAAGWGGGAKYWKASGGKKVQEINLGRNSMGWSMFISGNDIYILGDDKNSRGQDVATYWKNGKAVTIGGGFTAHSIFVVGDDVYVSGSLKDAAAYWKNGKVVFLSGGNSAESIFVVDDNVYAVGYEKYNQGRSERALYWKNGLAVYLSLGTHAGRIFIDGNDVYISGHVDKKAAYWKNGKIVIIGKQYSSTRSIFVYGKDIYVAGEERNNEGKFVAVYWKNGEAVYLSENNSGVDSIVVAQ